MYIVKYSSGNYEDFMEYNVFVTKNKNLAEKYVEKFKQLVIKVDAHYDFMFEKYGKYSDEFYKHVCMDRKYTFQEFNNVYFSEIDVR